MMANFIRNAKWGRKEVIRGQRMRSGIKVSFSPRRSDFPRGARKPKHSFIYTYLDIWCGLCPTKNNAI